MAAEPIPIEALDVRILDLCHASMPPPTNCWWIREFDERGGS